MKKILVTGAEGFVGKNLVAELKNQGYANLHLYTRENSFEDLKKYTRDCEFVFHLAGVNRPKNDEEFMQGNHGLTEELLIQLKTNNNSCPVLLSSSIQASKDNPYGQSKRAAEDAILAYGNDTNADTYVYRLPNLFGKWSRPNYNTVVATYCYNIARDLEIQVNNPEAQLNLAYIDDVIAEFMNALKGNPISDGGYCTIPVTHEIKLGELVTLIQSFKESRSDLSIIDMNNALHKKLYSTYLSFLPSKAFAYDLKMNKDDRGSFTEFIRTPDRGQVSVNISKPGITKGNHWHHTKNEKFLVVSGQGLIRFRKIDNEEVIEYRVTGEKLQVVDIPVGYTHSIVNTGETDLVTVMWVNESFDPNNPDTYFVEV